jgi:hypothetical protein
VPRIRSIIPAFVFCAGASVKQQLSNFPSAQAEMRFRVCSELILELWLVAAYELKRKMFMGRVVDVSSTWGVRIEPLPPPPAWISYAYGTDLDPCSLETS